MVRVMATETEEEILLIVRRLACDSLWFKGQIEELRSMLVSLGAPPPSDPPTAGEYRHEDGEHGSISDKNGFGRGCDPGG